MVGDAWDNQTIYPEENVCILWIRLTPSVMLYFLNDGQISGFGRKLDPGTRDTHWKIR